MFSYVGKLLVNASLLIKDQFEAEKSLHHKNEQIDSKSQHSTGSKVYYFSTDLVIQFQEEIQKPKTPGEKRLEKINKQKAKAEALALAKLRREEGIASYF